VGDSVAGAAPFLEKSGRPAAGHSPHWGMPVRTTWQRADWPVGNVTAKRGPSLEQKSDTRV
jgi:hypothetical protein